MARRDPLSEALAIIGVVLVGLPLLAPVLLSLTTLGGPRGYMIDFLMPFEVYPVTLAGAGLLVWASLRTRTRRAGVVWSICGMLGGVALAAAAAKLTGIADSVEQLEAWRYVLVSVIGALSLVAQVALIAFGGLLIGDLLRTDTGQHPGAQAPVT